MDVFTNESGTNLLIPIVVCILSVIALWRIFEKAGEKGWKALVPGYNMYILFKICWEPKYFWIEFALLFCSALISEMDNPIVGIVSIVFLAGLLYINAIFCSKLAKSFGKGTGFAVGLFFLSVFFQMILGFGSAEYNRED